MVSRAFCSGVRFLSAIASVIHIEPSVELVLHESVCAVDTENTVIGQHSIVSLGGKRDLIAQVYDLAQEKWTG